MRNSRIKSRFSFSLAALLSCMLLAGLTQAAVIDEPLGETIEMPPFVVTQIADGPDWRYASIPGFEIITQCSDSESREIVAALWRGPQLALPPEMRPHFSLPMTVVLFRQPSTRSSGPASFDSSRGEGEFHSHWTNVIKRSLEDRESFSLNLWGSSFVYSAAFRFDMRTLLHCRVPAVPAWLNEGLFGSYGVYREGVYLASGDIQRVHRAAWCSGDEIAKARGTLHRAKVRLSQNSAAREPSPLASLIPDLATILEPAPPVGEKITRWASTAALFVRWGIFSRPDRKEQFWRFARLASEGPVSEKLFTDCFGQSYAEVKNELSWYLAYALANEESTPVALVELPKFKFRDATNAEVGRIRGEWERIEAVSLKKQYPEIARSYEDQAKRNFEKAYNFRSRAPRLLASMGLLANETRNFSRAHELLTAAVAGDVPGPVAYVETARLQWAQSMTDDKGTLPAESFATTWDILLRAEKQHPRLQSIYIMGTQLLSQNTTLTPEQRDFLDRGLLSFPKSPELRKRVEALNALSTAEHAP